MESIAAGEVQLLFVPLRSSPTCGDGAAETAALCKLTGKGADALKLCALDGAVVPLQRPCALAARAGGADVALRDDDGVFATLALQRYLSEPDTPPATRDLCRRARAWAEGERGEDEPKDKPKPWLATQSVQWVVQHGRVAVQLRRVGAVVEPADAPGGVRAFFAAAVDVALLPPFFEERPGGDAGKHTLRLLRTLPALEPLGPRPGEGLFAEGGGREEAAGLRDRLFAAVLPADWRREADDPAGLKCRLYRYQRRCLSWMLWREGFAAGAGAAEALADLASAKAALPKHHPLWAPHRLPASRRAVWFNAFERSLVLKPVAAPPEVSGGILADEMGLGKTVTTIALVLANKRAAAAGSASGATLVVCPPALLQQWRDELERHAGGALAVQSYEGLRAARRDLLGAADAPSKKQRRTPAQREFELWERLRAGKGAAPTEDFAADAEAIAGALGRADVVVTTFDVLQREVLFTDDARSTVSLRFAKRYRAPTCPLLQVRWWRLVVDEAQLVGGKLSQVAQMVEKMRRTHTWCVSGTPVGQQRGVDDLQSLLAVLRHDPFADRAAWDAAASWPALRAALRPLMWRNGKDVAAEELLLPPRALEVARLALQPAEEEFYKSVRKHAVDAYERAANGVVMRFGVARRRRGAAGDLVLDASRHAIGELRLCCIHPQLTSFWKQQLNSELQMATGGAVSMVEVLEQLVAAAAGKLQERERDYCAHLNDLAGALAAEADAAEAPSPGGRKRRRAGGDGEAPADLRARALALLFQSYAVTEKGMGALSLAGGAGLTLAALDAALGALPEPPQLPAATLEAWNRLYVQTYALLFPLLRRAGRDEEAEAVERKLAKKVAEVRAEAERAVSAARDKLAAARAEADAARDRLLLAAAEAGRRGFPPAWAARGAAPAAGDWLRALDEAYAAAKAAEAVEVAEKRAAARAGEYVVFQGTCVSAALGEAEKRAQLDLKPVDDFVSLRRCAAAADELAAEAAALAADGGRAPAAAAAARRLVDLLPPFRRDKLRAEFESVIAPQVQSPECSVPEIVAAAARGEPFVAADAFCGRLDGRGKKYAFKLGDAGLGYHRDVDVALPEALVAAAVAKVQAALADAARRLARAGAEREAAGFAAAGVAAAEARAEALRQQLARVRALERAHAAECALALAEAEGEDVLAALHRAQGEALVPAGSAGALRRREEELRKEAFDLHGHLGFLRTRVEEQLRLLDAPRGGGGGGGGEAGPSGAATPAGGDVALAPAVSLPPAPSAEGPLPAPAAAAAAAAAEPSSFERCPICLEHFPGEASIFKECGHAFCLPCAHKLPRVGRWTVECPTCRRPVSVKQIQRVVVGARAGGAAAANPDAGAPEDAPPVRGEWSAKLTALLRRLLALQHPPPGQEVEKALVFSQFPDALRVVSLALKANSIAHAQLTGGREGFKDALRRFSEPDVRVFLLSHRAGAQGLTLTRASRVFLLEPALDPAIEQQAVARVHRIGQTRDVTVTRLLVGGTIEERVLGVAAAKQALFVGGGADGDGADGGADGEATTVAAAAAKVEELGAQECHALMEAVLA